MRRLSRDEGVVLGRKAFGEAHLLVQVLTSRHGRIAAAAYGARKPGSRFGSALEPGTLVAVSYVRARGDGIEELKEIRVLRPRAATRRGVARIEGLFHAVEVTQALSPPGELRPAAYGVLNEFLDWLEERPARGGENALRVLETRLLSGAGVFPDLGSCASCEGSLSSGAWAGDAEGLLCDRCAGEEGRLRRLDAGCLAFLRDAVRMTFERAARVRLSARVAFQAREFLASVLREYIGRDLRSLSVMDDVRGTRHSPRFG
jgi:DNA repair protein RecO (recombination protein O)